MSKLYIYRLKAIYYEELKSLLYEKLAQEVEQTSTLNATQKAVKQKMLTEQEAACKSFHFGKDLGLDWNSVNNWITAIVDELQANNLHIYLRDIYKEKVSKEDLLIEDIFQNIIDIYAKTLLQKGKEVITKGSYKIPQSTLKQAMTQSSQLSPEERQLIEELSIYPTYFKHVSRTMRISNVQEIVEKVLSRYFNVLRSYAEVGEIKETEIEALAEN